MLLEIDEIGLLKKQNKAKAKKKKEKRKEEKGKEKKSELH